MTEDDPRAIAIVAAIRSGDVDALQRQLKDDPELAKARIVDDRGVRRTLLHILADWPGHFPNAARTAAILVEAGADVNARVDAGETPLHWAASSDDVELLDALLDAGADIEANGAVFTGGAPMSDAVVFAQWNAARRLLERGARTTLWQSAALGLLDRVEELFDHDPPPSANETTNALWHACRGGQRDVANFSSPAVPTRTGSDIRAKRRGRSRGKAATKRSSRGCAALSREDRTRSHHRH